MVAAAKPTAPPSRCSAPTRAAGATEWCLVLCACNCKGSFGFPTLHHCCGWCGCRHGPANSRLLLLAFLFLPPNREFFLHCQRLVVLLRCCCHHDWYPRRDSPVAALFVCCCCRYLGVQDKNAMLIQVEVIITIITAVCWFVVDTHCLSCCCCCCCAQCRCQRQRQRIRSLGYSRGEGPSLQSTTHGFQKL